VFKLKLKVIYFQGDLFQQGLAGRSDSKLVQLGGDAVAIGIGLGGGETLAQSGDLMLTGATPANLRAAAGC
jgi:hypothetical protein